MKHIIKTVLLVYILVTAVVLIFMVLNCKSISSGACYEGSAMGYRGPIRVIVSIDKGTITEIAVIESHDDKTVGGAAIEELSDLILMYNTTELDTISGATETSKGFLSAVENAILVQ